MSVPADRETPAGNLIRMADVVEANPEKLGVLSTGERLSVAILLNRPDWIREDGYSLAGALRRLGVHELEVIIEAAELR